MTEQDQLEKILNKLMLLDELSIIVKGIDGSNGLRQRVTKLESLRIEDQIRQQLNERDALIREDIHKLQKDVDGLKKIVYIAMGVVAVLQIILPFIIGYFMK